MRMQLSYAAASVLYVVLSASTSKADVIITMDMNPSLSGIQNTIEASSGDTITAGIYLSLSGPTSLSAYNVAFRYDDSEVVYLPGSRQESAGNVIGPGGAFGQTDSANNVNPFTIPTVPGLVLSRFDGVTTGEGPSGIYGPVLIGQASFTVNSPSGNASDIDFLPGLFEVAFNENFDNLGNLLTAANFQFIGGSVIAAVPEPSSLLLLLTFSTGIVFTRRRK